MKSRGERLESPTHRASNACTRLIGSLMRYMVAARAAEKLSARRRTMTAAADHQFDRTQEPCLFGLVSVFSRQVKLLAPGQIPVFQRLTCAPRHGAEFGEPARNRRAPILRCAPKLHETSGRAGISRRFARRRALGTPRQSRQRDKAPRCSPRFDLYLVHRGLDTSDLKEAKSVLHDLRNPGGATR
jgi:hypothetical protein